ncbi:beta-propeller fold lactonase family protein [Escherichia coli]
MFALSFGVLAYRIAPDDGALTFAAESALPGSPDAISPPDHQGQFVFVGSYNAGNVSVTRLEDGLPVGVVDVVEGLEWLPFRQYLTGQPYAVGSGIKAGSHLPVYGQR